MNLVVTVPKWFWPEWIAEENERGGFVTGSTFKCQIHDVRWQCEAGPESTKEAIDFARIPECPVCSWIERRQLADALAKVRFQRDQLLKAIELKKEFLTTTGV